MTTNVFGPGHHVGTAETTSRPAPTPTGKPDSWFAQCAGDGTGGTKIDEMWLNQIVDNLRSASRSAGADETTEEAGTILSEAIARYAAGGATFGVDGGVADAYAITTPLSFTAPQALFKGMRTSWRPLNANTGASTLAAWGLAAKALLRPDGTALQKGDIDATSDVETRYDPAAAAGAGGHLLLPASLPLDPVTKPEGYLTLRNAAAGGPTLNADVVAATAVYYSPVHGDGCPIWNGSRFVRRAFSEQMLGLVASHLANLLYDVWAFRDPSGGAFTVGTGTAWATSTAGAGARGTAGSTTEFEWVNGLRVNKNAMTMRNGSTTYSIAARFATLLGTLSMDGTNGQITCHVTWGQSRKWGVSNAYNRKPLSLKAGDATATWAYNTNTWEAANAAAANSLTVLDCLAEEIYDLRLGQHVGVTVGGGGTKTETLRNGIGWNSTTTPSGRQGIASLTNPSFDSNDMNMLAEFKQVPALGKNVVTALEIATAVQGTPTWYGGEDDMILSAWWRG